MARPAGKNVATGPSRLRRHVGAGFSRPGILGAIVVVIGIAGAAWVVVGPVLSDRPAAAPQPADCLRAHADMRYAEAERCYTLLIEADASDWRWIYYRALIQADRGGGETLLADLRRVAAAAPSFSPLWLRLGDAEFKAGRYEEAAAAWTRVLGLPEPARSTRSPAHTVEAPAAAYATHGLARIALARGDVEHARQLLEPLADATPPFSPALRTLAEAYTRLGRDADAKRATYRAGRLPPYAAYADPMIDELAHESRNATLLLRLASEADLSINAQWSEYLTRRALDLEPDNPDVLSKLGRILRTVGRSEEALVYFRRYHALVPTDYQGVGHLGATLADLGRYDEAEPYLRQALQATDDGLTHYNLALLLAITGRVPEAIEHYRQALERNPADSNARINLATALARQGRVAEAVTELRRVVAADPDNELARINLSTLTGG